MRVIRLWRNYRHVSIRLLLLITLAGGWHRAQAQTTSPEWHILVEPRSYVTVTVTSDTSAPPAQTLVVNLTTQFWSEGRRLSIEELLRMAPHIRFSDKTPRGHSVLLAVPPTGTVTLAQVNSGDIHALPAPTVAGQATTEGQASAAVTMNEPVWLREQRVVRLQFQPVQYDPSAMSVLLNPEITANLTVDNASPTAVLPRPDPYWEPIYQQVLSNYQDGLHWRRTPEAQPETLAGPAPTSTDSAWRLRVTVTQPGLYEIGYSELIQLGLDAGGVDPRRLQIFEGASPLPSLVSGEEDGRLDPGDTITFYAPPLSAPSRYAPERSFWLVVGAELGSRVGHRSAAGQAPILPTFQHKAHLEVQRLYVSSLPPAEGADHWFWLSLRPERSGPAQQTTSFTLPDVATGPTQAKLRIRAWGQDEGVAHVTLRIAGYPVGAFDVRGQAGVTREFSIPHPLLRSGDNEIVIEAAKVVSSTNTVLLDWLEVDYTRLYQAVAGRLRFNTDWPGRWQVWLDGLDDTAIVWDVTNPNQPVALTGLLGAGNGDEDIAGADPGRVGLVSEAATTAVYETATAAARHPAALAWAPVLDELRSPYNRADYLIISPDALLPAAQRLAVHRAAYGLAAKVVTTQAIYDEFNAGQAHPEAIRAFLSIALRQWGAPAPAYVVLMGDATTDPLGYLGPPPAQVPAYLRLADPWLGEVADENAYAAVVGADIVPDLMLGRLPAGSLADAERLVDKIIAYDHLPIGESWQQRLLLAADNPDAAGDFTALAEDIATLAEPSLDVKPFYLADYQRADDLRAELLSSWNDGALIVNYIGHGHPSAWAAEAIFSKGDAPLLQNRDRPAVVLAMASLAGIFTQPGLSSLLEDLLLLPEGRGAIGYIASTGYGIAAGNSLVDEGFMAAILYSKVDTLGQAALSGKLQLYAQGYTYTEFLTRLYTLVGDPATRLPLSPWPQRFYLPLVGRGN